MKSKTSIIVLLLLLGACGNGDTEVTSNDQSNDKKVSVYVEEIQPSTFRHYLNIQGDVESDNTIMITPEVNATVEKINVRLGDKVKKNDVLAELDGKITKSQIKQVVSQLELSKTIYERQKNLRDQNIGSEVDFLQAKTQYESAQSQLNTLSEQFENYTIRATISGVVNQVNIKVGENVSPAASAFQLANSTSLKVTAEVSERYITTVDEKDSVEISFPSLQTSVKKRLNVVSKVINSSNRTFEVEIYITDLNGSIRPNMMASLKINDITLKDKIVVPLNTVQKANDESFVYVAKEFDNGMQAIKRIVTLGDTYNNSIVVETGLEAGEKLINAGYTELFDKALISIQEN
ncbi:MAG: efflux RND transporter periplasmic adaptor subunit [Balneola sp.]